jgi:hypothetical protein
MNVNNDDEYDTLTGFNGAEIKESKERATVCNNSSEDVPVVQEKWPSFLFRVQVNVSIAIYLQ